MLFTKDTAKDYDNILIAIESFGVQHDINITIRQAKIFEIVNFVYQDFPCKYGLEKANIFKKSAYFLCFFVTENPIESITSNDKEISDDFKKYANTILGLYIVAFALKNAVIHTKKGDKPLPKPIKLSKHSYWDIIEALSDITPLSFKLVTVLLEQLVYKENINAQYMDTITLA